MKYHIKAGQTIVLGKLGWADPDCERNINSRKDVSQHANDKEEAAKLGLHLSDYYRLQESGKL